MLTGMTWLPDVPNWAELLNQAHGMEPERAFEVFRALANSRLDFVRAGKLDKSIAKYRSRVGEPSSWARVRLAFLGSSTLTHLSAGIRLGALRRGVLVDLYEGHYGTYRQELEDPASELYSFRPEVVCLALDAHHVAGAEQASTEGALAQVRHCWRRAQESLGCVVIQQTVLPVYPTLMGNNEDRWSASPAALVDRLNFKIREAAEADGVYVLAADRWAAVDGISTWHDPALWNRSKQEIHPRASNIYGDQLARVLAALRGKSAKCLVLDLDNTLWGGVIGDDGLEGIVLGQGSAVGEAHLALQQYALQLSRRGVILAVCSKNDEGNAHGPFERHSEMLLRRKDIACFIANWQDKAANLRQIASDLNIGLDSLVFVDDNPVERALIRRELPMVGVPELSDDPAEYVACLANAGYFEALHVTAEDRERAELYRANAERDALQSSATDMESFLRALQMELTWSEFDEQNLKRIAQLINKTNQFNLTTQRYTEADVASMMRDPEVLTLQLRLTDSYGDNGIIGIVIGRLSGNGVLEIDTWLMSCRVLGRKVEEATLNIVVERALDLGCDVLMGSYRPTAKNGMVADHYGRLGFDLVGKDADGISFWSRALEQWHPKDVPMRVVEGAQWKTRMSIAS